jgi:hypothetical protein
MSPIDYPQWILVRLQPAAHGKTAKIPLSHQTLKTASALDPANWLPHATARAMATMLGAEYAIGFVLTDADPFFCVDVDSCLLPDNTWSSAATGACAELPGTMVEVSQSGRGIHVWGAFQGPVPPHSSRGPNGREMYHTARFIVWGTQQTGTIVPHCEALPAFIGKNFPPSVASPGTVQPSSGPRSDWVGPTEDSELLRRALQSRSVASKFGDARASFADLWTANWPVLEKAYPGNGDRACDLSRIDSALASHLAFWTGCDPERMERLMRQSSLVRDKWDNRPDYLRNEAWSVIDHACAVQIQVLQDKPVEPPPAPHLAPAPAAPAPAPGPATAPAPSTVMAVRSGETLLDAAQQAAMFANHVYIVDIHKILCPGGMLITPDRFKALYGGYSFRMDAQNTRISRNAFEAFTESQMLSAPKANTTCFRPDLPFGHIVQEPGRTLANTYWPVQVPRKKGDPTRFLNHVRKLYPAERDFQIVMAYCASCVQYIGYKFQWALLLQGVEGNGKTLISRCVANSVGQRYVHWPAARKLDEKFNAWLVGKVLICVEDVFTKEGTDVFENLKPMITGDTLEVEAKGVDQASMGVVANLILNTNHIVGGLRKTRNDRRLCVLHGAQQAKEDLVRDGMGGDYMSGIYNWLKNEGGYAIVAELLHTWKIPEEFDPTKKCQVAPWTTSTDAAIEAGHGPVEQAIMEAVEQGEVGFRGGWISSIYLDRLLARIRKENAVPPNRRRFVLENLGYFPAPGLAQAHPPGRTNNVVMPDGSKPRLYVRDLGPASLLSPAATAEAYTRAQGVP